MFTILMKLTLVEWSITSFSKKFIFIFQVPLLVERFHSVLKRKFDTQRVLAVAVFAEIINQQCAGDLTLMVRLRNGLLAQIMDESHSKCFKCSLLLLSLLLLLSWRRYFLFCFFVSLVYWHKHLGHNHAMPILPVILFYLLSEKNVNVLINKERCSNIGNILFLIFHSWIELFIL